MVKGFCASIGLIVASTIYASAQDTGSQERLQKLEALYGKLSPDELVQRVKKDILQAKALVKKPKQTVPPTDAYASAPLTKKNLPNNDIKTVLLMRDVYSTVAFITADSEVSQKGASFTYTSDRVANTTTLAGKGALFLATFGNVNTNLPGTFDPNINRLTYFSFVPGFEWDITSKKGDKSTGAYSARAGLEMEFQGAPITTQYVRTNAIYTTDVETSTARIYGVETSWQPKIQSLGINGNWQVSRDLKMWVGFYPTLGLDYFHVGQTAKFANLTIGNDYFWVGPKVQADLFFEKGSPLERFSFTGSYFYLYDTINGRNTNVDYGQASATVKLVDWKSETDPTQLAALSLLFRYTKGTTPRTLERTDEFYTGLTIKLGQIPQSKSE